MQPSAQDFIFDWHIRPIEKDDLSAVAVWIAALSGGEPADIYGALLLEFHQAQITGFPDLYAGLVDDQLVCYISGTRSRLPQDRPALYPRDAEYKLHMMINTQIEEYDQLWAPAWSCTIQYFFLLNDITQIRVYLASADPKQARMMEKMGFVAVNVEQQEEGHYTNVYTGTRDDFRPLF